MFCYRKKITTYLSGRHFILKWKQVHLTAPTLDNSVLGSFVVFKRQYNFILWAYFWIIFKLYNVSIFLYCRKHNCHFLCIRIVFYFIVYYLLRHFYRTWLARCLWASAPEWHKFGFSILQVNLFVSCGDRNSDYLKPKNGIVRLIYLGSPRLLPASEMAGCGDLNYVIWVYLPFLYFLLWTLHHLREQRWVFKSRHLQALTVHTWGLFQHPDQCLEGFYLVSPGRRVGHTFVRFIRITWCGERELNWRKHSKAEQITTIHPIWLILNVCHMLHWEATATSQRMPEATRIWKRQERILP